MPHGLDGPIVEQPWRHNASYTTRTRWRDLRCHRTVRIGPFDVKTTCAPAEGEFAHGHPRRYKLFVRLGRRRLANLYDYARLVQAGAIRRDDHDALMRFVERQRRRVQCTSAAHVVAVNHNLDVGTFHVKFRCEYDADAAYGGRPSSSSSYS